ncbi:MAG TPA: transporter substrate-binding domain-containing protein [Mesorhizobium sp.]|jgi:polar amino acid transport system substrate-binding protein|uniref:transporter substrate-binding domain-containing protein n=1 Tax=Mesorhizobium sp. TaxID=1871066 RepID=UPI002DDD64E9|nr:transporter substrate-binding domain-containing protein [Mesorhizobium sp.]HEV2503534.1 transporter substrate-binding domain-containing protein [Mesorhizobium sp.]
MTKAFIMGAAMLLSTQAALAGAPSFVSDGAISVCTTAAFPPLSYKKDPGDTVPVGIDIEITEALAKTWGAKTSYVITDFAGLLPTLGSGRCGMIVSGIYVNEERRKTYDGVRYMKSATVLVTKADNSEITAPAMLSGRTVALEAGTYYREERLDPLNKELTAAGKPAVVIQNYPAQQGAYQQVLVGRADATLTEEAEGAFRVAGAQDQLKIAYTWQSDFTYGIYVARKDGDAAAIKVALKTLREQGFFARLAEKYGLNPAVFDVDYES